MQDRIFYSICFGFIGGVLIRSFLFVNFYVLILFCIISFALFLFFSLISKNKIGILFSVFILVFCFGILQFNIADKPVLYFFESKVDQRVSFSGEIVDEPTLGENNQKLVIQVENEEGKTKILISTNFDENYKYGDEVSFTGIFKKPDNFITDQGKNFDYINYLKKDGIFYVMSYPNIEIISRSNGNKMKSLLFSVKEKFLEKINFVIKNPENLLMGGLILGEKSAFDQSLRQSFVDTGTIHIVALSGYNITIVAEWFVKLFAFLPQNLGIGMGILSIFLFVLMTGAGSTAVRAGIMASLALYARASGRNYDVARALLLAGIVMIILNPFVLVYDVSFQLSFIATIALIFFTPKIEKYFLWVPKRFGLRDIISVTSAVYVFVLPFILYKMGNLSLVALPANVMILPFVPFTMLLGFLTGFLGIIHYFLSVPLGYISYLMLHYELSMIGFFAKIPFASLTIPDFPLSLTLLIYTYFIYRLFGRSIKNFFEKTNEKF